MGGASECVWPLDWLYRLCGRYHVRTAVAGGNRGGASRGGAGLSAQLWRACALGIHRPARNSAGRSPADTRPPGHAPEEKEI